MTTFARRPLAGLLVVGLAVAALTACQPSLGRPALRQVPSGPRVFDGSDPDVLVTNGHTYLFGSTNNMKVPVREITTYANTIRQSQDGWAQSPHDAMPTRPAWVNPSRWEIWAPSLIKIGAKYELYFASHRTGAVDLPNDQCIGRAVSTKAMGPYTPEANPIYCGSAKRQAGANPWGNGALDPEVIRGADGKLYLFMALSRTADTIGAIRLDSAGRPVGGINTPPAILASVSLPFHDGSDDGRLDPGGFLENPSMIYEPQSKTYLLFYSAGHWFTDRYLTGFARCSTPVGPCALDRRGPFLKSGSSRTGPGGLTAYTGADGKPRVAYASWTRGHENTVGVAGEYSRQVSWALLVVTGSDPAKQTIALR